jgi:hypothetical protein
MMNKKKVFIYSLLLLLSIPATYYFGSGVVFYLRLNAPFPEGWFELKTGLWAFGAFIVTLISFGVLKFSFVGLIKESRKISGYRVNGT